MREEKLRVRKERTRVVKVRARVREEGASGRESHSVIGKQVSEAWEPLGLEGGLINN